MSWLSNIDYGAVLVWRRNADVFFKTWKTNFLPSILEPLLYLVAMGAGLGGLIVGLKYAGQDIGYVRFLAPGLVAISIMYGGFFECTYGSFVRMHYQKTFDAIVATPLSIDDVISGELLWGATRSFIYSSVMLLVFTLFGVVSLPSSLLVIPFSFLAGLLFACIAMCFTAITPSIDALNYPSFLFITPMFLFSGTFFPLSILPSLVQQLAIIFLPLTQLVIVTRSFTLADLSPLVPYSIAWIGIVTLIFFILSTCLMRRRLIV